MMDENVVAQPNPALLALACIVAFAARAHRPFAFQANAPLCPSSPPASRFFDLSLSNSLRRRLTLDRSGIALR